MGERGTSEAGSWEQVPTEPNVLNMRVVGPDKELLEVCARILEAARDIPEARLAAARLLEFVTHPPIRAK